MKYFIWTLAKTPQIWHDKPVDGQGKTKATLFLKELNPFEGNLSVNQLAQKYPCPNEAEK
jgi:hypothetical protein